MDITELFKLYYKATSKNQLNGNELLLMHYLTTIVSVEKSSNKDFIKVVKTIIDDYFDSME